VDIKVDQSHGGSSAQARAVNDGLAADVVTFNTTTDVDFLAANGVVAKDWAKKVPATHRPPPRPCCSWCATATPRTSRTGPT
jgi:sulfate transport system substrate-binding protein